MDITGEIVRSEIPPAVSAIPSPACSDTLPQFNLREVQQLQHLESYDDKELLNYLVDGVSNVNQLVREYVDLQDKSEGVQGKIAKCRSWWFQNLNYR